MELLDYLIEKRRHASKQFHPFIHTTEYFRKIYAFGVGILALGHMNAIEETRSSFLDFLASLALEESFYDSIIIDINNNFEYRLNDVFSNLDTKQKQYCFCLDLYRISFGTVLAKEYTKEIIRCYMRAFHFSVRECDFFENFMTCAKNNDLAGARKAYSAFIAQKHLISYQLLTYAYPNYRMQDTYGDRIIDNGEQLLLDKPTVINGTIKILNSSILRIEHADVILNGSIDVDGGKLHITDSVLQVNNSSERYAISICNTAGVIAEGLVLNANYQCGFFHQQDGVLVLRSSTLKNATTSPGIYFSGRHMTIEDCHFENCSHGGIHNTGNSQLTVWNSRFVNCNAENGGGIYSDSQYDTTIRECRFVSCNARYNGGAVYFKNKKYGQTVKGCKTEDCTPRGSIIFNSFEEIIG